MGRASQVRELVRFISGECERQNLSQRDLVERSGIGQATISRLFSGQNDPSLGSLEAIASGLGYSLMSFLFLAVGSMTGFRNDELMTIFEALPERDQELVLALARQLKKAPPSA